MTRSSIRSSSTSISDSSMTVSRSVRFPFERRQSIAAFAALLIAASARPTLNKLAHWNLHHKEWVRLALGSGVVLMGLLILATV